MTIARRYSPGVLGESSQDELMTFMLVFLSTGYMKNPYLKGQFVEVSYLYFPVHSTAAEPVSLGADYVFLDQAHAAIPSRISGRCHQLPSPSPQAFDP